MKKVIMITLCITIITSFMTICGNAENSSLHFNDVPEKTWYYEAVYSLVDENIISGTSANTYSPDKVLTREEATVMLFKIISDGKSIEEFDFNPTGEVFIDVPLGKWYTAYIEFAYKLGIIDGIGNNEFGVGLPIKRQDFALMISKLFYDKLEIITKNPNPVVNFKDYDQISDYALSAMTKLCGIEYVHIGETYSPNSLKPIFSGSNGYLFPLNSITRAEVACVLNTTFYQNQLKGVTKSINDY